MPFALTNSSTAAPSSKWPTMRASREIMPRMRGISAAATRRRSPGASGGRASPPKAGVPAVFFSSQSMARLMISTVVS